MPRTGFLLIGEGPSRARLEEQIAAAGAGASAAGFTAIGPDAALFVASAARVFWIARPVPKPDEPGLAVGASSDAGAGVALGATGAG